MTERSGFEWRKSTRSGSTSNCVEVGYGAAAVAVRDTKDRDGGTIVFTPKIWTTFLNTLKTRP